MVGRRTAIKRCPGLSGGYLFHRRWGEDMGRSPDPTQFCIRVEPSAGMAGFSHGHLAVGDLLLHSLDGGKTWRQPSPQSGELAGLRNVKIQFQNPRVGWIMRLPPDNHLVTKDGGKNWTPHRPPTKPAFMDDLLYLSAQEAWLAAGRVYHSTDGGVSWKPSLGPDPTQGEPRYNMLQYVANEHLLIATSDQGISFCKLSPGIPDGVRKPATLRFFH
jgi:photosystem II stability/assembly factor-like uncharacterized protein